MGKLQPNWSWQKYEADAQDNKDQFQYQLQAMHIATANTTNATIDDASFFTRERQTSFTWIDGKPIYTKTFSLTLSVAGNNPITTAITGINQVIRLYGMAQDATPLSTFALPLPYPDGAVFANQMALYATPTQIFVVLNAGSPWVNYVAWVTIEYTKV
jgi:hypothetical protein